MSHQGIIAHYQAEVQSAARRYEELTQLANGEIETAPAWENGEPIDSGAELATLEQVRQAVQELLET